MSWVFLSHSSRDSRQAIAVKACLVEQEPGLAEEIYLDLDPHTGHRPGARWKQALRGGRVSPRGRLGNWSCSNCVTIFTPTT